MLLDSVDKIKNESNFYCKNKSLAYFNYKVILIDLFIKFLDKIEIEMEIADPLREYTSSHNNSIIAKEPISA